MSKILRDSDGSLDLYIAAWCVQWGIECDGDAMGAAFSGKEEWTEVEADALIKHTAETYELYYAKRPALTGDPAEIDVDAGADKFMEVLASILPSATYVAVQQGEEHPDDVTDGNMAMHEALIRLGVQPWLPMDVDEGRCTEEQLEASLDLFSRIYDRALERNGYSR